MDTPTNPEPGYGFDVAINALKRGCHVRRTGWNGKGMRLELQVPDEHSKMTLPYIFLVTPNGVAEGATRTHDRVPWLASQTDLLANDWQFLEPPWSFPDYVFGLTEQAQDELTED